MKPVSPVIPGHEREELEIAKDQPEYQMLPAIHMHNRSGDILTRWRLTWRGRLMVLLRGDVYLWVSTFYHPLQPLMMQVERPELLAVERPTRDCDDRPAQPERIK